MKTSNTDRPDTLTVRLNERQVGTLTRLIDETIVFAFDPNYEADAERPIVSLSYKSAGGGGLAIGRSRTGTRLSPFFSNLLPEGHLRDFLASQLKINSRREFFLLAALGMDLPGALIVEPINHLSSEEDRALDNEQKQDRRVLRFSLAGVQLKFSAITNKPGTFTIPAHGTGGSWIVKLPSQTYLQLPEIEHAMLTLAKEIGIEVPESKLVPTSAIQGLPEQFGKSEANSLAVKRFDRADGGARIHMEDFAQVYGIYPKDKYAKAGYGHIAQVLWREAGESDFSEFVRRLVFTVAIGNGDMHLKNWSLIYPDPLKPSLSPAYDLVPTIAFIPKETLALNLGGTKEFKEATRDKFKRMAVQAGASERLTVSVVQETVDRVRASWQQIGDNLGLPEEIGLIIDRHMSQLPLLREK